MLFSDEKISLESTEESVDEEFDEEALRMRQLLKTKMVDLDLFGSCFELPEGCRCGNIGSIVCFQSQ